MKLSPQEKTFVEKTCHFMKDAQLADELTRIRFDMGIREKVTIDQVRNSNSPVFLKINTARYKEHVGPGEDFHSGYRDESEINKWKSLDPLINNKEFYSEFLEKINKEIEEAVKFGLGSQLPDKEDLLSDV